MAYVYVIIGHPENGSESYATLDRSKVPDLLESLGNVTDEERSKLADALKLDDKTLSANYVPLCSAWGGYHFYVVELF